MPTIYDLVTANNIAGYWNTYNDRNTENLLGDELFEDRQKLGLKIEWIKGASGIPVVLKPSAYDVAALKADRIGFETVEGTIPFFKNSKYVDEETRQQLNMILETGNRAYIDAVVNRIFDDSISLLRGARAQRERMKMSLITSGTISISANGQDYDYDYGLNEYQNVESTVAWSNPEADIIGNITKWLDDVENETGVRPERAVLSPKTFSYMKSNKAIRYAIWGRDLDIVTTDTSVKQYFSTQLGLKVAAYSKKFIDEAGVKRSFIPDDVVSFLPSGKLGYGWFGTTPEQSDLMAGNYANVSIVDTGVAITTTAKTDPVNVDTKVSMSYLPSFEAIDNIVIADVSNTD